MGSLLLLSETMEVCGTEEKETKPKLNSKSVSQPRSNRRRKRRIRAISKLKRIRGFGGNKDTMALQYLLSLIWVAFVVPMLCDNKLVSLPLVNARPIRDEMCLVEMSTSKLDITSVVGLQPFGKLLRDDGDSSYAYLTILPGMFKNLCHPDMKEAVDFDLLQFPPGDIAIMVDTAEGGCDVLTKSLNAVWMQEHMTRNLKYVLFYSSDLDRGIIPKLDLDTTMAPTPLPTTSPPTLQPTLKDTTISPTNTLSPAIDSPTTVTANPTPNPTQEPSVSMSPSVSFAPSNTPTISMEPSLSTSPSGTPSEIPTTESPTTQSPMTQQPSESPTSQYPTLSQNPTTQNPTTQSPTTQSPTIEPEVIEATETEKDAVFIRKLSLMDERQEKKQALEDNNSMVFLSLSMEEAITILAGISWMASRQDDKSPEFAMNGNENWDVKMFLSTSSSSCVGSYPTPMIVTSKPSPKPSQHPFRYHPIYIPTNDKQPIQPSKSYADDAPGSFTIFKFVLFSLLIASPCLRLLHQWWVGGGRIRFRRSQDEDSNRVVGLQYIPPMDNWFGGPLDANDGPRPPDRLTLQQIMGLPEIQYTKPIHHDDKLSNIKTIEEADEPLEDNSDHVYNQADDTDDNNQVDGDTEIIAAPDETDAGVIEHDGSIASEASFENEPSVRLELPTSPPRVSSSSITQASNPLSPRAIVQTEELPLDEEQPEEHEQEDQEPQTLQQPMLSQPLLSSPTASPKVESPTPVSPTTLSPLLQDQPQQCSPVGENPPLSFRTQRRLQSFTTTTCTMCSICIDEFEEGETLRLLPRCGHAFHTDCILPWLRDRQGCCPLCKMEVLDHGSDKNNSSDETSSNERRSSF